MSDSEPEPASVSSRPLCRRYALAIAAVTHVRLREGAHGREHPVFWVFGWLADGECEPLGFCIGAHALPRMLGDLERRGLQRIWRVAAPAVGSAVDAEIARAALLRAFPQALAGQTAETPPEVLAVVAEVGETVMRAIRRHRLFEDEAQALDVVALALQRAERRLDGERRMAA